MLAKSSLPVQGAWIEMSMNSHMRGEFRRSPCRERGLKFSAGSCPAFLIASLPVQGAWIEIFYSHARLRNSVHVAPRAGSVD